MSRIKIKNFGPIKEGYKENAGWLDIKKVTVFIGNNGSGKSTVAKLISMFCWLEKALIRKNFPAEKLNTTILYSLCKQHDIYEYFKPNTQIAFDGMYYNFTFSGKSNTFTVKINKKTPIYILPKIQYVSSARNLLTILYQVPNTGVNLKGKTIDLMSSIPFMVRDLSNVYFISLSDLAKNGFELPVGDIKVFHQNHSTYIMTEGKHISMAAASSGIQSITPLMIVSKYLSGYVRKTLYEKLQDINEDLLSRIERQCDENGIRGLLEKYRIGGSDLLDTDKDVSKIENVLKEFLPSYFVNIVEEPEQNLFPISQQSVLNSLIECNNLENENKLILSTHSPYILTALNNSIFAAEVYEKTGREIDAYKAENRVSFDNVAAYECVGGKIFSILDNETRLINADAIDSCSVNINSTFDELLDLLPNTEN